MYSKHCHLGCIVIWLIRFPANHELTCKIHVENKWGKLQIFHLFEVLIFYWNWKTSYQANQILRHSCMIFVVVWMFHKLAVFFCGCCPLYWFICFILQIFIQDSQQFLYLCMFSEVLSPLSVPSRIVYDTSFTFAFLQSSEQVIFDLMCVI